jgi:hypothetical protein
MTNLYLLTDTEIKQAETFTAELNKPSKVINSHLENVFHDEPKKCFENAIKKNAFSEYQVTDPNNYIMYMCSSHNYDYFKSKMTKTKYKVKR